MVVEIRHNVQPHDSHPVGHEVEVEHGAGSQDESGCY